MTTYDDLMVDIGNAPNDDQGDPLRTAFDKINQRFAELRVFLNNRGDWAPNTIYTANPNRDWVIVDGVGYLATSNHTSGATFAADLAAGKWVEADALLAIQEAQAASDAVDTLRDDLASTVAGKGAELVAFRQAGAGAVNRTALAKMRDDVNGKDYPLIGDGVADDTVALQNLLNTNAGQEIVFDGTYFISAPVTVSGAFTKLIFRKGAGITYSNATMRAVIISGNNVTIEGLSITGPSVFDGVNVQPTYACVWVTGNDCKLLHAKLTNIPKVGVMFQDCENGAVVNPHIIGNYPSASFTGTEVMHAAIVVDSGSTGKQGGFRISGGDISRCVQGVLIANYGATSRSQGISVLGVSFNSIWNHGVYAAGQCNGVNVTGNTFVRCQVPVALTGAYHVVSGNTMTTGGSSSTYTDITGISLRDPTHCVVSGNVVQGDAPVGGVVINLAAMSTTIVRGNIVQGNTIITSEGSSTAVFLGSGSCSDLTDNIVANNVCIGGGSAGTGLIVLFGESSCKAHGTSIDGNSVVVRSASHGIQLINVVGAGVSNNRLRLEHNAASAVQLGGVVLSDSSSCEVRGNTSWVTAGWGSNVTYFGVFENGTPTGNIAESNAVRLSTSSLALGLPYFTVSGSGIVVHDSGDGVPNLNAGTGSTWRRTDGGASTSFYVKESGSDAAGWVGK